MRSSPVKPTFEALSPDLQWHLCQRRERMELAVQVGAGVLIGLMAMPMVMPELNRQMDISLHEGRELKLFGITVYKTEPALANWGILPSDASHPVQVGDRVGGFLVTSGYGPRPAPCPGCSRDHRGVDLATPTETPLYAPATKSVRVKVNCWRDSQGGGLVADITSPDIPDLKFQALHLSACATGLHAGGSVIAHTGDTGNGTGPHLDWRQRDRQTQAHQPPQVRYLQWALTGDPPRSLAAYTTPLTAQELVQSFEGFQAVPYWDYQQWSSGYGTPAQGPDEVIDRETAEQRLREHLAIAARAVDELVTVPLTPPQRDALISFQYNTGGLAASLLLRRLNGGDYAGAADELLRWNKVEQRGVMVELAGLTYRRRRERALFLGGSE